MKNTLELIIEHGISVRQIPKELISLYDIHHFAPGDEVHEMEVRGMNYEAFKARVLAPENFRFDDNERRIYRRLAKRTTVPNNAGMWMAMVSPRNTYSRVTWSLAHDNLAPTLEEAVAKCIAAL